MYTNPNIESQSFPQLANLQVYNLKQRARNALLACALFLTLMCTYLILNYFITHDQLADATFYRESILNDHNLQTFWAELAKSQQEENKQELIAEGTYKISRAELGRMGWTMLHMITGSFPEEIPEDMRKKFNAFLGLFSHLYPCKLCAKHFIELLKEVGQFQGKTKGQLMHYMCGVHNLVNRRLGKQSYECAKAQKQWNTCGCGSGK